MYDLECQNTKCITGIHSSGQDLFERRGVVLDLGFLLHS